MTSDFLWESQQRGFLHQATDLEGLDQFLNSKTVTGYIGFDATAPSLHVGNLVALMWLRLLKRAGHQPLVVLGDATTRIGDPSGKDSMRPVLSEEKLNQNLQSLESIFHHFLPGACVVRNGDWLLKLNYLDFLRDFGGHFSVNRMLTFDSVRLRLEREQPLSFLEFNYMIFQAYDFLHLSKEKDCFLQMGGSDQWGNIINGVELIRRATGKPAFGLTAPLVTTATGQKMGKTEKGAIWLRAEQLPPYDYWQFWRNTDDRDVGRYLRLFTEIPLDEIARLEALEGAEINEAKRILADHATIIAHDHDCLDSIHKAVQHLFYNPANDNFQQGQGDHFPTLSIDSLPERLDNLFIQAGLVATKGEFKRLVTGQGARLNDEPIDDLNKVLSQENLIGGRAKLSAGKKKHVMVVMGES